MNLAHRLLSIIRRITVVIAIAVAFLFGLATTVYLSLRSREVTVPNVVGKDRFEAEKTLGDADLNFRVRAARPSNQVKSDTVLFQLPPNFKKDVPRLDEFLALFPARRRAVTWVAAPSMALSRRPRSGCTRSLKWDTSLDGGAARF